MMRGQHGSWWCVVFLMEGNLTVPVRGPLVPLVSAGTCHNQKSLGRMRGPSLFAASSSMPAPTC